MVKIICGACSKPLSIDETKLPMKEVSFPCPLCKTKLKIDRNQLPADSEQPHRAEVAGTTPAPAAAPVPVPAPAQAASPSPALAHGPADDEVPAGASKALIIGENSDELQQAAQALGFSPVHRSTPTEGRDYYLQEFPEVVLMAPSSISQPPMDELTPMTSVGPAERRRSFFILVGDKFRSLDGNAAFLYGVNLVVARNDLPSISRLYREARVNHDRLARPFRQFANE